MGKERIYKYNTEYVDVENIDIDDEPGYRYSMFVPFKDSITDKLALVIMRNPSKADKTKSDKTINNVLRFCSKYYSGVYIANLYPNYETDSTKVKDFIESDSYGEKMIKNYEAIDKILDNIEEVIVAWGTSNTSSKYDEDYETNIEKVLENLNNANKSVFAMRFASSNNPWHPRNWEESFDLELYRWT
ncbi:DUF1643 domain-containing protein [Alkalihalobacterium bogoriense]|uniref:DUF1643 domain-containing protein n=1 Tax=Alkalihalobacterium bogoriense TaxID=246272 RepID=UPI000687BD17|nr:DUF1643 domain-containing protein [Alkalihalobacterium bogoriense]